MQNFLEYERGEPSKRNAQERIKDFNEIYTKLPERENTHQAQRCVQCSNPYCSHGCPLDNHIPQWLKAMSNNDIKLAFELSNQTSPFPEIMGKVCPQDRLCEKTCTLNKDLGAVTIGFIENHINQKGFDEGLNITFSKEKTDKKVAIIGSGPAGLSVATFLLRAGVEVVIYERDDRAGGLLTYGIPSFKLEKSNVQRRVKILTDAGAKIVLNCEVGKDISFEELQNKYDSIFIGIGATDANTIDISNINAHGVYNAMEILTDIQKALFENKKPNINLENKKVIVIGGGDTAMDCLRVSIREKAQKVSCLYRRDESSMPGSKKERVNAKDEDVKFHFHLSPSEIMVDENNHIKAIKMQKTKLINGKLEMIDEFIEFEADIIILSLGFHLNAPEFITKNNIALNEKGVIKLNNYKTSLDRVYAGGDCFRGADLVVNAALDGREAAKAIINDLNI
jgi:glutamate synthase (NADPH/NADH) small chain